MDGQSLLGTSHQEAVHALQNLGTTVTLLVCDGYNNNNHDMMLGKLSPPRLSTQVGGNATCYDYVKNVMFLPVLEPICK